MHLMTRNATLQSTIMLQHVQVNFSNIGTYPMKPIFNYKMFGFRITIKPRHHWDSDLSNGPTKKEHIDEKNLENFALPL